MTILKWDKPKKVMTTEQWANHYGFDGGPAGGYAPNMDIADQLSWKAKITGTKLGFPQVEIKKTTTRGSQLVIIVNLGEGYNYKYYRAVNDTNGPLEEAEYMAKYGPDSPSKIYETKEQAKESWIEHRYPTRGINIHLSTNGPVQMTFDEMAEMNLAVEEAKLVLSSFEKC